MSPVFRVALEPGDRATLRFDGLSLVARYVPVIAPAPTRLWRLIDAALVRLILVVAMVHVALVAMLAVTPRTEPLFEEWAKNPGRLVRNRVRREPPPRFKALPKRPREGVRAPGREGKFGRRDAKQREASPARGGGVDVDKREHDRALVAQKLSWLRGTDTIAGPGIGGIAAGIGGLTPGARAGTMHGLDGFGARDLGGGGGGGPMQIGQIGVPGGEPGGPGPLAGPQGRPKDDTPPEKRHIVGGDGLPRDVVARTIARHQNEIRWCYENALKSDAPGTRGKVAVRWVIGPDGRVADLSINEDTMGSSLTVNCMTQRIARWVFPSPRGGGVVHVTFPWIFKPAGE